MNAWMSDAKWSVLLQLKSHTRRCDYLPIAIARWRTKPHCGILLCEFRLCSIPLRSPQPIYVVSIKLGKNDSALAGGKLYRTVFKARQLKLFCVNVKRCICIFFYVRNFEWEKNCILFSSKIIYFKIHLYEVSNKWMRSTSHFLFDYVFIDSSRSWILHTIAAIMAVQVSSLQPKNDS